MTAAPLPADPPPPATAEDLGHKIRFPQPREGGTEWRSVCSCHWWHLLDPVEAKEAFEQTGRAFQ